jgi:hypothetical protein
MPMMPLCVSPVRLAVLLTVVLGSGSMASAARGDDAACINAVEQALTLRTAGKLRDALKTLAACSDPACPEEVRVECTQRIAATDAAMPTLIFSAKDGAGNDLLAVTVTMNGAPLTTTLDGRPVPIDPGEHAFRFETVGQPPVDKTLVVREGEKNRIESVVLGAMAPPPPATATAAPVSVEPSSWNNRKTLAVVAGGVGVVGVGLGIVWSAYASSAQSQERSNCSASGCPNRPQSVEDYNTAQRNATAATVSFIAGAALVAAGVVLWVTAPANAATANTTAWHVAPEVLPSGGGLSIGGLL